MVSHQRPLGFDQLLIYLSYITMACLEGFAPSQRVLETLVLLLHYRHMKVVAPEDSATPTYRLSTDCSASELRGNVVRHERLALSPQVWKTRMLDYWTLMAHKMVESRGVEPLLFRCKRDVLPLSLRPQSGCAYRIRTDDVWVATRCLTAWLTRNEKWWVDWELHPNLTG